MADSAINEGLGIAVDQVTTALMRHGVDASTSDLGAAIDSLVERTRREALPTLRTIADSIGRNASGTGIDNDKRPTDFKAGMLKAYQHCLDIVRNKMTASADPREPRGTYLAHITANQAQNLLDYFGGGSTTYVLLRCEKGDCANEDGTPAPAGLYVYDANCPEEGVTYLGDEDEDSEPRDDSEVAIDQKYDDVLLPFARLMAKELHANAGKGDRPGWLQMSAATAMLEIYHHAAKLQKAVKDGAGDAIGEYAADVANLAMMLLDVCGGLEVGEATSVSAPSDADAYDIAVGRRWREDSSLEKWFPITAQANKSMHEQIEAATRILRPHFKNVDPMPGDCMIGVSRTVTLFGYARDVVEQLKACEKAQAAERAAVPEGSLLIDVRGKWYDVPIPVHLHIIALRDKVEQVETVETLVAVYDAVSRSNITRDVKTPETKARIVMDVLSAAPTLGGRLLSERWQPIETAPKDRPILLWGEVDGGERGSSYTTVMASWCSDEGMFGEDGGWLVSFTDDCIASVERPTRWMPCPGDPEAA